MTTQLRLVDTTDLETTPATPRRARLVTSATGRGTRHPARAVRWPGELHLDARTRKVGRAGVAAAREALERVAAEQERSRSEREGRSQKAS